MNDFWQSVSELAAMREQIPEERRAGSGVREAVALDILMPGETQEEARIIADQVALYEHLTSVDKHGRPLIKEISPRHLMSQLHIDAWRAIREHNITITADFPNLVHRRKQRDRRRTRMARKKRRGWA